MRENHTDGKSRRQGKRRFGRITEEIYGRNAFLLLSVCLFYLCTTLWWGALKPVYLSDVRLYLDSGGMKRLAWAVFLLNYGGFCLLERGPRSLPNLVQTVLFPLLACHVLQKLAWDAHGAGPILLLSCLSAGCAAWLAGEAGKGKKRKGQAFDTGEGGQTGRKRRRKFPSGRICRDCVGKGRVFATLSLLLFWALSAGLQTRNRTMEFREEGNVREADVLWSQNRDLLSLLSEEAFRGLTPEEKLRTMQGIVELEMISFGIDRVSLLAVPMENENEAGYFDVGGSTIYISDRLFGEGTGAQDCLNTVLHECYHAYELSCIRELGRRKWGWELRLYEKALSWQKDILSYQTVGDAPSWEEYAAYYGQSVEEDARMYAAERGCAYLEYIEGEEK